MSNMHEGVPKNKHEKILQACSERGIEVVNSCADLTDMSFVDSASFLKLLVDSGDVVLHGTNSDEVYNCLETRQGHCLVKESGRKVAVYATMNEKVAMSIAVLNRSYLKSKFDDYAYGYSGDSSKLIFKVPPEIYKLFVDHDPNLFSDGYVYVLDKDNFVNAPDAGGEWHSESNQEPLLACRISQKFAEDIYVVGTDHDTVIEFDFEK